MTVFFFMHVLCSYSPFHPFFFFLMIGRPPRSPLFPYPTLFRSRARDTIQTVVSGALDAFNAPRVLTACSPPRGTQFRPVDWLRASGTIYLVGTRDAQADGAG